MSRPLAIARSHADASVAVLLVVGTDGREWAVHRVAGAAAVAAEPVLAGSAATVAADLPALAAGVDLVVVDAPPAHGRAALRAVSAAVGPARLLAVDPVLLGRFGAHRPLPPVSPAMADCAPRPVRRWPAVVAAAGLVAAVGGAVLWSTDRSAQTARVAVGGVRVEVPGQWRRTELAGEPAPRAVLVDPATGSRIIVAVSPLRAGATPESVAASLAQRIRQRGDDAVGEFAARAVFAGRTVTAYRETPDSGAPIRWYVRIVGLPRGGLRQFSVGCQDAGGPGLENACRRAVASAGE